MKKDQNVIEYIRCKNNFLYFLLNYVKIPEIGGARQYTPDILNPKLRQTISAILKVGYGNLMATRQLGKALAIDTPILLANSNYTTMGELEIGDFVLDEFNEPVQIINTTPILYNRPCFNILFDTDETIICDENHLWCVNSINNDWVDKVISTKDIVANYTDDIVVSFSDIRIMDIRKIKSEPVRCIQVNSKSGMFQCGFTDIPTHNSTISAALLEYSMNFFPGNKGIILNMQKTAALENLNKVKFMHENLPEFLKSPLKYKGDRKTYLEYANGSILRVFYPSSATPADQLARSLSSPILYIDECAFINHIEEAYASAQPTLSKAREQAKRSGYPSFIMLSSTPNGIYGSGEFYYKMWQNGIDSEIIFDENNNLIPGYEKIVNDPSNNGFVNVKYHWSEDVSKDDAWYAKQKRELNFDTRRINTMVLLKFG